MLFASAFSKCVFRSSVSSLESAAVMDHEGVEKGKQKEKKKNPKY
jgi:hypothetical protein